MGMPYAGKIQNLDEINQNITKDIKTSHARQHRVELNYVTILCVSSFLNRFPLIRHLESTSSE